ncbi:MAG: AMIN domain-containing protein [Nitrospirae bacterium]|nr:AMIN domain-containing protein [Nitrospirota bacterium]
MINMTEMTRATRIKGSTATILCLVYLCSCTPAIETTRNAPNAPQQQADNAIISTDLAKEPVTAAAAKPSVPDNSKAATAGGQYEQQTGNAITSIEVTNELVNITASKPFGYKMADTKDSYTKRIELFDVSPGRFKDIILPGSTKVADMKIKSADNQRAGCVVVLTLASDAGIKDKYANNTLTLAFDKPEPGMNSGQPVVRPPQNKGHLPAGKSVTGVRFAKDADNAARVEIEGDGLLTPDVSTLNGRVVVDLRGVKMAAVAPKDVAPPVRAIRWAQYKDKVRIVMDLSENAQYKVDGQGERLVIIIGDAAAMAQAAPVEKKTSAAKDRIATPEVSTEDKPVPSPTPQAKPDITTQARPDNSKKKNTITLNFNNVDILAVLKLIAYVSDYNIVVDPHVIGKVTIHVKDMPWDKALDLIMESTKLKKLVEGDVIKIVPGDALTSTADIKSSQPPIHINDLTIMFSDAGGEMKIIKRANVAAGSGSICLDINPADIQQAIIPHPAVTQKAATQKKAVHAKVSHKKKVNRK